MKTIFNFSIFFLLLTILFIVTACGTQNDRPIDEDICRNPEFANFEEKNFTFTLPKKIKWDGKGNKHNFDLDIGLLVFGEHAGASEGPDNEPLGGMTLWFDTPQKWQTVEPNPSSPLGSSFIDKCLSRISLATLSTTDVRRGTSAEINGRRYEMFTDPRGDSSNACDLQPDGYETIKSSLKHGFIEFFYVSSSRVDGWFCVSLKQISPDSGEPFTIAGSFAFH